MPYRGKHAVQSGLRAAVIAAVLYGLSATSATAAAFPSDPSDPCRCAALQRDFDAYRRGEVQYFVDPTPAWTEEAARYGCGIPGLDAPPAGPDAPPAG
ncbi:hypothetical protein [Streptomyces sp. NPDC012888]|uniref:hypothetical protein n=1 Tax=Streptomyces sp. NPDC012888 TaxID=3364855 RepID=UPI0036C5E262